jgi:RNA polymerase subunit RPABC4/transcription elongation factor Spt4
MSLRRCPSCTNTVERDSDICPICGKKYANALISKIMRWIVIVVLVVWVGHHFFFVRHT